MIFTGLVTVGHDTRSRTNAGFESRPRSWVDDDVRVVPCFAHNQKQLKFSKQIFFRDIICSASKGLMPNAHMMTSNTLDMCGAMTGSLFIIILILIQSISQHNISNLYLVFYT